MTADSPVLECESWDPLVKSEWDALQARRADWLANNADRMKKDD
jgi:hypothetical protein